MNRIAIICAALALPCPAIAENCIPIEGARKIVADTGGKWIELTSEQWQFMRGAYYANPMTPARLPFGDKGVMATSAGGETAMVFFIDGDRACDMLKVPTDAEKALRDVGEGAVVHEEKGP